MNLRYKNKMVGSLDKGIFRKIVKGSKHLMRIYDAWGIDDTVFEQYLLPLNVIIRILDEETGTVYSTDANTYKSKGFVKDYGDGLQIFLARKNFGQQNKRQPKLL